MKRKKAYIVMSCSAINIEEQDNFLLLSGELGSTVAPGSIEVDTFEDGGAFDAYLDPLNPDNPYEF